jgi:hypothetical protein
MKSFLFIGLALSLSACGLAVPATTQTGHSPSLRIEQKYLPYVKAFEARAAAVGANIKVTDLSIVSVPKIDEKYVVAQCLKTANGSTTPSIIVSQEYWTQFSASSREELLFHEMGHCVLNRPHRADEDNGISFSIMNPIVFGGRLYIVNYKQYMHELFYNSDLASALPLVGFSSDTDYIASIQALFSNYNSQAARISKEIVVDESAPVQTTLSDEELSHLGCGEE